MRSCGKRYWTELFTLDMPQITSNSAVQFIELTETLSTNAINWSAQREFWTPPLFSLSSYGHSLDDIQSNVDLLLSL